MASYQEKRIQEILPFAKKMQDDYGIPASITIAQAIQESGWITSTLASIYNNWFGEKATGDWTGGKIKMKSPEAGGIIKESYFRTYANMDDAVQGRANILTLPRYQTKLTDNSAQSWANALQAGGYAGDKNYANALMSIIKSNNLTKYDTGKAGTWKPTDPTNQSPVITPRPSTGGGGKSSTPDIDSGDYNFLEQTVRVVGLAILIIFTLIALLKVFDIGIADVVPAAKGAKALAK